MSITCNVGVGILLLETIFFLKGYDYDSEKKVTKSILQKYILRSCHKKRSIIDICNENPFGLTLLSR